jgi:hypothetical protein
MKIKAYKIHQGSGKEILIKDSAGLERGGADVPAILDFLLEPYPETLKTVWNLDDFTSPILRLLNLDICRKIARTNEATFGVDGSELTYSLYYLPDKLLTITKIPGDNLTRQRATIYGLNGFFDDNMTAPASAEALEDLGNRLLAELGKIGVYPKKLTSPLGAFLSGYKLPYIPTMGDTPEKYGEAQIFADNCTGREWREAFQIGYWASDECFMYDLSSAYPSEAARLPDLRYAEYFYSKTMIDTAYWGFLRGRVTLNGNVRCSPIMTRLPDGRMVNPVGCWNTFLTLDEVRFIYIYGIGSFQLIDGWFIEFTHGDSPLAGLMEMLYRQRTLSDPIINNFLKRVASGLVGKFREHHDTGPGDLFNPIYHAAITANVRLKVASLIYENNAQDHIIRINTDGVISNRALWIAQGKGLGRWRQIESQAVITMSPELVLTGDKHPRGLHYAKLRAMICKNPKSRLYETKLDRRVTLPEAVRDNNLEQLGKITKRSSHIDLTLLSQSQSRYFPGFPRSGQALIDGKFSSSPIKLGGSLLTIRANKGENI